MPPLPSLTNAELPVVTIVTTVYNGERYIAECMRSVFDQNYKNIDYLIIDAGSTDGTVGKVLSFRPQPFRLISEKDSGLFDGMNKGINNALGEFIIFLHADDFFVSPESLSRLVTEIATTGGEKWGFGFYKFVNSTGQTIRVDSAGKAGKITLSTMLIRNVVRHQAALISTSLARRHPFSPVFKRALDYDHFLRIWEDAGPPIIVPAIISGFRVSGTSLSSNFEASLIDEQRVRSAYRKRKRQYIRMLSDYIFFSGRFMKILLYHRPIFLFNYLMRK